MSNFWLFLSYLLFISFFCLANSSNNTASCPIDFTYVNTFPWDTQECGENAESRSCCQTLRSLLGMGLATYLKDSSNFYLPTPELASSCLSAFQTKLATISRMNASLVSTCLNNSNELLLNHPSDCAGIRTIDEWNVKAGLTPELNTSCQGDMRRLTQCNSCFDAGMKMNAQLVSLAPNSTKCFYFTIFYAAGIVNQFGPADFGSAVCILGLPLAPGHYNFGQSSGQLNKNTKYRFVFGFLGGIVGVLMVIGLIHLCRVWDKRRKEIAVHDKFVTSVRGQVSPNVGTIWYHVTELERATDGFSRKNFIGQGGYGVVYKGTFASGSTIAVKQITDDLDSMRDEEFCNEVDIISKIRHRNLLPLRGCCVASDNLKGKRRYLVYDYMPNGSLSDHLFDHQKKLTWPQRKNIILDVAKGLAYLHYGVKPAVYHRDIKTTNILLDSEMRARVADFGLAKQSVEGQSHLTTRVAGTYGYLPPEYALYGQLTEKNDVYSFGIVILETMTGKKVLDTSNTSTPLITDLVWSLVKSQNVEATFDESIRNEGPKGIMDRYVRVGLLCAHVMVAFRPTIAQALKMLEGDIDIPKLPERPLPLAHESFRLSSCSWRSASTSRQHPTLKDTPWGKFPFTGLAAMVGALGSLMIDAIATGHYRRAHFGEHSGSADGVVVEETTNLDGLTDFDRIRYKITSQVLEMGIVVHSIIIGISLGTSQSLDTIKPLIVALCFHQFFEGIGLGGCIAQAAFKSGSTLCMALFFSLTTPVGVAIGFGITNVYDDSSPTALVVQGLLNSVAGGILIYMALVDLLAQDFMNSKVQTNTRLFFGANVTLLLGAGIMALLAIWA
uniref:non-specific serine/threonine protein kinase n=1 Tax=Chenopodium quinoa TaxID=63459 RepID=A0A803L6F8_CHEQI